jgi:hypothetical protein
MAFEQWSTEHLKISGNNNIPESMRPRPVGQCKDAIAGILADSAENTRALEPCDDHALDKLILHHWETCTVQTVRTFTEDGIKPTSLMFLLMAAVGSRASMAGHRPGAKMTPGGGGASRSASTAAL